MSAAAVTRSRIETMTRFAFALGTALTLALTPLAGQAQVAGVPADKKAAGIPPAAAALGVAALIGGGVAIALSGGGGGGSTTSTTGTTTPAPAE